MVDNTLQPGSTYIDGQLVQLAGPDNTTFSYQYNKQQDAFFLRNSISTVSGKHGSSHVSTDPVPNASCDASGLMSSSDKCKLDSVVSTRLGVLGFQGAGFPDDGGYLSGDITLSAGSEFISLERVGNVIRFVVDVPTPFTCTAEECFQIYWIQDESDTASIRPPTCSGKLPGVNAYGELKIYLFPESTLVNPNDPLKTLKKKGSYPSLIFKRYDDGTSTNTAELDLTLQRNSGGSAIVGWAFTPGATGTPECRWWLGTDKDGNRVDFHMSPNSEPSLLGAILYKGHSITKKPAVITGYSSDVLTTNRYKAKWWSMSEQKAVGSEFTVTNIQQWDFTTDAKVLDASFEDILREGQIIDVHIIKCSETECYYCVESPVLDVDGLWATLGVVDFGDKLSARKEEVATSGSDTTTMDLVDQAEWGMTNIDDPLLIYVPLGTGTGTGAGTGTGTGGTGTGPVLPADCVFDEDADANSTADSELIPTSGVANYIAEVVSTDATDNSLGRKYLQINDDDEAAYNVQRPIFIWHRSSLRNALMEVHLARPIASSSGLIFPPVDVLLRSPISTVNTKYAAIYERGTYTTGQYKGYNWMRIGGLQWHDLPKYGAFKVLIHESSYTYGLVVEYAQKVMDDFGYLYVVTGDPIPEPGTILELLHEEYTSPAARLQFRHSYNNHDIQLQPTVGALDMSEDYGLDTSTNSFDDFVRGFSSSSNGDTYWQDGSAETTITGLKTSVDGFYILNGGVATNGTEYYNVLKIMVNESRVWMWWNDLLMSPANSSNAYFTISDVVRYGKFGVRLWPGAKLRRIIVRSKVHQFSEYSNGQISIS